MLGGEIGGTTLPGGLVLLRQREAADVSAARVLGTRRWGYAGGGVGREEAVERLVAMLKTLAGQAEAEGLRLAPFVGLGCPGVIRADGVIERGGQNLPGGGWEGPAFNLPSRLAAGLPDIDRRRPTVVLHNDAVVQGLHEAPRMGAFERWGVLTIGTGLGNARFTNRQ